MHKGKVSDMLTEIKDKVLSAFSLAVLILLELAYMAIDAYEKSKQRRHKH